MRNSLISRFAVMTLVAWLLPADMSAQEESALGPLQPTDTSSAAATLNGLIQSCNELQVLIATGAASSEERESEILPTAERILDCLDLSELPKELRMTAGIESALFLKEVIDRIELPADEDIPAAEEGVEADQASGRWQIPQTRITIARLDRGPNKNAWLFTPDTVRNAAQYYRIVKDLPYRTEGRPVSAGLHDAYVAATRKMPTQATDTSSPRGTMTLFLDACNELHELVQKNRYLDRNSVEFQQLGQRIVSCLDTSQLPDFSREFYDAEAAVCLKEVLDRIPLPAAEEIPGIESVETLDGTEALTRWQVPRTQIVISKMEEGPRRGEFLFSSETVARAPSLYNKTRHQPYRNQGRPVSEGFYEWWLSRPGNPTVAAWVDGLPEWFQDRYFGLAIWQWIGLILIMPLAIVVILLAWRQGRTRIGHDTDRRNLLRLWLGLVFPVIAILIPLAFKYVIWEYLTLRGTPLYVANFCADLVLLLGVTILIVRSSSRIAETLVALPGIAPRGLDANLIRIVCRVLGIAAAIIVFLEGGRYLGFPLTTLIASAGIGGLAIALSAQGLIKGMFGTVTILLDKPFRVGQRIIVKGHDGVVEEIGLRSTKIRALDDRLISIPNDHMAEAEIENIGEYTHLRRKTNIHIPLDTARAKVEEALTSIREVLDNHEGMDPQRPPRVDFTDFNEDSFNIRILYWFTPADLRKFNEFNEKVNLEVMRVFEQRSIQFSLPFRHTYWKQDNEQGPLEIAIAKKRYGPTPD